MKIRETVTQARLLLRILFKGAGVLSAGLDSNAKGGFNPPFPASVVAILNAARG